MTYELIPGAPSVADYRRLREVTGLSPKTEEAAKAGLPNSWFAVTVHQAGRVVGMGRVIGDGGTAFQVTDIAVLGDYRGQGLGKRIVAALVGWLAANAPKSAYVSLIADGPARDLYAQYGFRETAPESVGMAMWIV